MLSGAVLSYSSWRGDGNPNLKGCKARLFQQQEDKRSALQTQHDAKGDDHSPPPSPLPPRGPGAGQPPSQTIKLHPFQGCSLHRLRQPHLHDRERTTRLCRYNRYLTTSELHAQATRWPTALGRRSRDLGVPAASSAPSSRDGFPIRPMHRSNSPSIGIPFANRNRSTFLSKLLGTKEEEEDSHGNCLEKEDGQNLRAVKQRTSM